jgi:hypothetical protein
MKKLGLSLLTILVLALAGINAQSIEKFSFVALADMPYFLPEDYNHFEHLIEKINTEEHDFNVFLGDFKSSKTPCEDSIFLKIKNYFNQFEQPLIYTPGDNEWTDCKNNPEERLEFIRTLFFDSKQLQINQVELTNQSTIKGFEKFIENKSWFYKGIQFSTFHIVGSNNNLSENPNQSNTEYLERDKANINWLKFTFENAVLNESLGIILLTHADMFTPDKGATGFDNFLKELALLSETYNKPILLINGDSHKYLIDKPLKSLKKPYRTITNFTRLQVYGEYDPYASLITINPSLEQLFEFSEILINTHE